MAVFQGARLRTVALPGRASERPSHVIAQGTARIRPRLRPTGMLLAGTLTATMLGLVYLTQTLASNAASVEIRSIAAQREDLGNQLLTQRAAVELWAGSEAISKRAVKLGLVQLDEPRTLKAP